VRAGGALLQIWPHVLVLSICVALKAFYREARAEELDWVLRPTARLAGWLSGREFVLDPGAGYLDRGLLLVIAPACAGVNFLIVAFFTAAVGALRRMTDPREKCRWLVFSALLAYGATVMANATRIAVATELIRRPLGVFSPATVHRLEGIFVYLVFLLALHVAARRFAASRSELPRRPFGSWGLPLAAYAIVTLLVPALRTAVGNGLVYGREASPGLADPRFMAHAGCVLASIAFFGVSVRGVRLALRGIEQRRKRTEDGVADCTPGPL
jgi:exosortase K